MVAAQASCSKRKREAPVSNNSSSRSRAMPLVVQKAPPSPTMLGSRCEDEDDGRSLSCNKKPRPATPNSHTVATNHEDEDMAPPMSPRVRKRLDDAKENASLFGPGENQISCTLVA